MLRLTRFALVAMVVLAGCHTGRPEPAHATASDSDTGSAVGGPGTICALGERSQGSDRQAHECNPGLTCCYPCGIPGCDSVCMADCGPPRP